MDNNKSQVTVVAVKRNFYGSIDSYLLSNGKLVNREQMVALVEDGWVFGYDVAVDKYGGKSIKANKGSNLTRLNTLPDIKKYNEKHKITAR